MKKRHLLLISVLSLCSLIGCNNKEKEVTIIFTNDTHGEINGKLSFATVGAMKKELKNQGKNVLLLDSGDAISGGFYTTYDKGKSMVELMNDADYDAATLGNHEFDYDFTYLKELIKSAKFSYISTNFYNMKDGNATTRFTDLGSKVFNLNGVNVGVIGISTPESISTSTPSHFQDEHGKYIYTFMDEKIFEIAQKEIDAIKDKCDFVVCLSHLGDESATHSASALAKNTSGIDVILDGHTHFSVVGKKVQNKEGKDVLITQAGGKFSRIGKLTLNNRKGFSNELISVSKYSDENIKAKEKNIVEELDKKLNIKIATSTTNFTKSGKKEDNIGDLCAEASYYYYNLYLPTVEPTYNNYCDISFVNSGGVRTEVAPGDWTLRTCKNLHPFGNGVALVKMKGSLLRTALEFSSYKLMKNPGPDEGYFGGLQQTCGVQYTVDTSIPSDIVVDVHGNYVSGPTNPRLESIKLYDRNGSYVDLEDTKDYYVGGSSYVLLDGGDGFSMFKNNIEPIRQESGLVDYDVLVNYIKHFTKTGDYPKITGSNSPLNTYPNLKIDYDSDGYGQRINLK